MILEKVELVDYNRKLVGFVNLHSYRFNRTTRAFDMSFSLLADLSKYNMMVLTLKKPQTRLTLKRFQAVIDTSKFLSNEYRQFPMQFTADLCKVFNENSFGMAQMFLEHGNITCPFRKVHTGEGRPVST